MNSSNSSRPPASDPPFGNGGAAGSGGAGVAAGGGSATPPGPARASGPRASGRKPGKRPGAKGEWRDEPLKTGRTERLWPSACDGCGPPLEMWDREARTGAAFPVLELARAPGGIRIARVEHRDQIALCPRGHETEARPATGVLSFLDGRKRRLHLTGRGLVAPSLAAFIAALAIRHHQSRRKIRAFLPTWFGMPLPAGPIDRRIREVGVAREPVVEGGSKKRAPPASSMPTRRHGARVSSTAGFGSS